ncbi:MAG: polysaccharide biosynthesis protein [Lentisphaerae bacterium]|jgi:FlaA1/EpsC-like NDP-sugar epimerase|nr:polysaccharide biosynthesis protein [Lentisphaerota bacterium]
MSKNRQKRISLWTVRLGSLLVDTLVMASAYLVAFLLRFDFHEPWWGWRRVAYSFVTVLIVQLAALALFGCYKLLWRYTSVADVPRFVGAIATSTVTLFALRLLFPSYMGLRPPYSITLFNGFLVLGGLLGVRLLRRLILEGNPVWEAAAQNYRRMLLVGAGSTGNEVARELRRNRERRWDVVGFLDDDPTKMHAWVQGVPVLGVIDDLPHIVKKKMVDEIIVTMVKVPREVISRVIRLAEQAQVPIRIVPTYYELIENRLEATAFRKINVADLLGRDEVKPDNASIIALLGRKRVLVTGAGGTIGSELVRQIMRAGPEQLVMLDRSENALYNIEREIRRLNPAAPIAPVLADIGERERIDAVLVAYRPQVVVHAAAYKHVPMMEHNPGEALKNNVLATQTLGEVCVARGVERFVFISTDKAVNPASVMGLTKRMAEVVLQDLNRLDKTCFSAVRFGNVLDSSGSVVPLFREQIQNGQPITVTHPDMRRYFMTIGEAVSLVLQAAALAKGGEIFVLDMGEPIRIVELAEEMIVLSGLRPHVDVPIVFTGIRPGEKLFEELDVSERSAYQTGHARIFISKIRQVEHQTVATLLEKCRHLGTDNLDKDSLRTAVHELYSEIANDEEQAHT